MKSIIQSQQGTQQQNDFHERLHQNDEKYLLQIMKSIIGVHNILSREYNLNKLEMSSSKSNKSNDSSRSNLLTLSQDSSSSEMRSHQANIYYQKFISKLGFLFRIDTKDLDALYNKIVECVDSSEGFAQSNDADILQLIELAKKLRHNHNLLKNMVEVLDQRFLQKNINSGSQIEANNKEQNKEVGTPKYDKSNTNKNDINVPEVKKQKFFQNNQTQQSRVEQSIITENGQNPMSQLMVNTSKNRSKYEQRVGKMFEEMNKIKGQLNKIQSQNQNTQVYKPSQKSSFSSNNGSNIEHQQQQNEDHQVFMKLQENDYYLTDDRYLKQYENTQNTQNYMLRQAQKVDQNIPKLSLKDLYTKMGINPNQMDNFEANENERTLLNGMIQIKETSRESEDFFEIPSPSPSIRQQNKKYIFDPSSYLLKAQQKNFKTELSEEEINKQKEIQNSNSVGNLTNATLQSQSQQIERKQTENKQFKSNYHEQQNVIGDNYGQQGSSQKSQTISNVTIIDKLTTPFLLHTKIEVDKNSSRINDKEELSERDSKFKLKDQFKKKPSFYTQILERNQKSREKINSYLSRLDERNKVLNSYVKQMEKSLGKQKPQKQQISTQTENNSRPLSNQIYVQNELVVPKYVPKRTLQRTSIYDGPRNPNQSQISIKQNKNFKVQTQQTCFNTSQVIKNQKQSKSRFSNSPISFQQSQRSYHQLQNQNNKVQKIFQKSEQNQIPFLTTLVQNNEKNKNELKDQENKYKKKQEIKKIIKQDHEISLELTSKNSIEDRMEPQQIQSSNEQNNYLGTSNQFVIPRMTTHSLFEQTRNVQSKIELSDERGYKMKVPGEQIEKIKNRVNQMFKKMKYIRNDPNNSLKHLEISQQKPLSQSNQKQQQSMKLQPPIRENKKFEIRVPQQNKIKIEPIIRNEIKIQQIPSHNQRVLQNNVYQSSNNFSSIIHKIDSPKPQIHLQRINNHIYNNPSSVKNSLVINPPRSNTPVRLSFMYESSNNTNRESQNIVFNQKISNIISNSRESSFSFQNKLNKYDHDSIRSSLNTFPHKVITNDSVSSSRERKQFVHQSPNHPRSPQINRIVINRPPSTRSSSNQAKSSITKPVQQIKIVKNAPPLPPRIQSPSHFAIPTYEIPKRKIQNPPSLSKRISNVTSTPFLLQKPRINIVKEQYGKNNSSKCIDFLCPQQNKGLNRYYSSATLNNSYVSKYNSNTSIPFNNPALTMTTPHSQTRLQSFSNISDTKINRTNEKLENSRHESKSSSKSHKSRKGIGVSLREQKL